MAPARNWLPCSSRMVRSTLLRCFFVRTHHHSTMAIATGSAIVSAMIDISAHAETGLSSLVVVAHGIESKPRRVTIR